MANKMSLEVADAISKGWGKFLEITNGNLMMIFISKIPESLLPYPKGTIEEALNIVAENLHNQGNTEAVNTIQATIPLLAMYVPDREAIENAVTKFRDKKYLSAILPNLGDKQQKQLAYIIDKKRAKEIIKVGF